MAQFIAGTMFISYMIFAFAVFFSPAHAALQASIREQSRDKGIEMSQASIRDQSHDKGIEMPQEATCGESAEAAPNSNQVHIKPEICSKPMDAAHELKTIRGPSRKATMLHVLGNAHREIGQLSKALEFYEEAMALQDVFPQLLMDMAETHARLGSLDVASRHVRQALESLESLGAYLKRGTPLSLDAARAHKLDGFIHLSHGDASGALERFNIALSILDGAVKVETEVSVKVETVSTLLLMTRALRDLGRIEPALAGAESLEQTLRDQQSEELHLSHTLTQKADIESAVVGLELLEQTLRDLQSKEVHLSRALTQKANILRELKRFAAADEAMKEALELQAKIFGNESLPEVSSALNIYGRILHDQGNLSGALVHYQQALVMNLHTVGQWHPETAAVHNNLGSLFQDQGDMKSAGFHFDACLQVQLKALGEDRPEVASTYNNMATMLFREGRAEEAAAHLERALSILDEVGVAEESPDRAAYVKNLEYVTSQLYDASV